MGYGVRAIKVTTSWSKSKNIESTLVFFSSLVKVRFQPWVEREWSGPPTLPRTIASLTRRNLYFWGLFSNFMEIDFCGKSHYLAWHSAFGFSGYNFAINGTWSVVAQCTRRRLYNGEWRMCLHLLSRDIDSDSFLLCELMTIAYLVHGAHCCDSCSSSIVDVKQWNLTPVETYSSKNKVKPKITLWLQSHLAAQQRNALQHHPWPLWWSQHQWQATAPPAPVSPSKKQNTKRNRAKNFWRKGIEKLFGCSVVVTVVIVSSAQSFLFGRLLFDTFCVCLCIGAGAPFPSLCECVCVHIVLLLYLHSFCFYSFLRRRMFALCLRFAFVLFASLHAGEHSGWRLSGYATVMAFWDDSRRRRRRQRRWWRQRRRRAATKHFFLLVCISSGRSGKRASKNSVSQRF